MCLCTHVDICIYSNVIQWKIASCDGGLSLLDCFSRGSNRAVSISLWTEQDIWKKYLVFLEHYWLDSKFLINLIFNHLIPFKFTNTELYPPECMAGPLLMCHFKLQRVVVPRLPLHSQSRKTIGKLWVAAKVETL